MLGSWISSKEACEILNIKQDSLWQSVARANKKAKKFCRVKGNILPFKYVDGIGAGGKVLEIFVEGIKKEGFAPKEVKSLEGITAPTALPHLPTKPIHHKTQRAVEKIAKEDKKSSDNKKSKKLTAKEKLAILEELAFSSLSLEAFAISQNIDRSKLLRWKKDFKEYGIEGLEDKRGALKNAQKIDYQRIKEVVYASGSIHTSSIWHYYNLLYPNTISESTFYRAFGRVKTEDKDLRLYLKSGLDGVKFSYPSAPQTYIKRVNEQWQIDATRVDMMVLEDGIPTRKQAIAIVDVVSGWKVWGLYDSSNSYANVRLLKKAIETLGMPETIKGDNGSDYVSAHFQSVLGHLGILYIAAPKGTGRAKGKIENGFRSVQHSSVFENLPGFISHSVAGRNEIEAQNIEKLQKLSGAKTNIKNLLTLEEMEVMIDSIMREENLKNGWVPTQHDIPQDLYARLGKREVRIVSKKGIEWQGNTYLNLSLWSFVGYDNSNPKVLVVEDINDISKVYAWMGERFLECVDAKVTNYTAEEWKAVQREYKNKRIKPIMNLAKSGKKAKDAEYKKIVEKTVAEVKPILEKEKKGLNKRVIEQPKIEIEVANNVPKYKRYEPSIEEAIEALS